MLKLEYFYNSIKCLRVFWSSGTFLCAKQSLQVYLWITRDMLNMMSLAIFHKHLLCDSGTQHTLKRVCILHAWQSCSNSQMALSAFFTTVATLLQEIHLALFHWTKNSYPLTLLLHNEFSVRYHKKNVS